MKYVPNNRCKFSHYRDSCRLGTLLVFDFLVPLFHCRVFVCNMVHRKVQNNSCNGITTLRNAADTMLAVRIVATWRQTKVVLKALAILKTLDNADS